MDTVKIFVEGVADREFLLQYIISVLNKPINEEQIISLQGKDKLKLKDVSKLEKLSNQFVDNARKGGTNLLIFDANGDKGKRLNELNALKQKLVIDFIPFLLPNDTANGALEDLLINIVHTSNQTFLDCFGDYETCLSKNSTYKSPVLKTKVYAYIDTLDINDKGLAKEGNRDYLQTNQWDFNSAYILPLKTFLLKYL